MVHTQNTALLHKSLLWVGLLSIIMFFAGLTSAVVVSKATSTWITYTIPQIFLFSTLIIITSSFTYQMGYRFVKESNWKVAKWLFVLTATLGILFIVAQFYGWSQLINQGIFATGTDSSVSGSYFYIIVALHLLHFVAAILSLGIVTGKTFLQKYTTTNHSRIETSLVFWHFLSALWLYVFFFLQYMINN